MQSWSILTRVRKNPKEAFSAMLYLSSSIALDERPLPDSNGNTYVVGSDLNLAYVYLFCCNFLKKYAIEAASVKLRNNRFEQFKALLAEAYFLYTQKPPPNAKFLLDWFNSFQLWYEMGNKLEQTPFVLLAEDCYWESYLRAPLLNNAIKCQIDSMIRYKNDSKLRILLEKGYRVCPWNTFIRNYLVDLDTKENIQINLWKDIYEYQVINIINIIIINIINIIINIITNIIIIIKIIIIIINIIIIIVFIGIKAKKNSRYWS